LYQNRSNFMNIRNLSVKKLNKVNVLRGGKFSRVESTDLVPGDVVEIEDEMELPCDMVLLSGEVLVDEAMLTGEAIPVSKPAAKPSMKSEPKSKMFGGTKILQIRKGADSTVLGRVWYTGFSSERGRMVRSILFPSLGRDNPQKDGNRYWRRVAYYCILWPPGLAFRYEAHWPVYFAWLCMALHGNASVVCLVSALPRRPAPTCTVRTLAPLPLGAALLFASRRCSTQVPAKGIASCLAAPQVCALHYGPDGYHWRHHRLVIQRRYE
jgi:hypothetical protein